MRLPKVVRDYLALWTYTNSAPASPRLEASLAAVTRAARVARLKRVASLFQPDPKTMLVYATTISLGVACAALLRYHSEVSIYLAQVLELVSGFFNGYEWTIKTARAALQLR